MNCDECKDQIDQLLDNELDEAHALSVRSHLSVCVDCARLCEELASILELCSVEPASEIVPPNSKALWCRINNVIESEIKASEPRPSTAEPRRFWRFSFAQLTVAFVGIAVVSSLLTIVAIKNYLSPLPPDVVTRSAEQSTFEKVLSKVGLIETPQQARNRRLQQQRAAIEYWNQRVQARRSQWDRTTREAFDRNMQVIDESVNDYTLILQKDPDDELSGEMLDSVLNDKMNLLRDFSDL
jgi:hypothetical protein